MKNKILLAVVLILTIILFIVTKNVKQIYFEPVPVSDKTKKVTVNLLNESDGSITNVNIEDYIIGVVAAEMPASFEPEALKAQAVAARTYAMYKKETRNLDYDLIIGTKDQAYQTNEELLKKWGVSFFKNYLKVRDAVLATEGEILTYNGQTINAFYFSMSNGYTENVESVFKSDLPYLKSVPSTWDNESIKNYEFTKTISKEDFCKSLEIPCDNIKIENIQKTSSNRVASITINGKTLEGTKVRSLLGLRSTDFTIECLDNDIKITTKGYGHGVGMSQYGANGMAKENHNYKEILNYFYQNTEISKINV